MHFDTKACTNIQVLEAVMQRCMTQCQTLSARTVANVLWGLARLNVSPPAELLKGLLERAKDQV